MMNSAHLKLLSILRDPENKFRYIIEQRSNAKHLDENRPQGFKNAIIFWAEEDDDLNRFIVKTDDSVYYNAIKELANMNIIEHPFQKQWLYLDESTLDSNLCGVINEINRYITKSGQRFLDFFNNTIV